MLKKTRLILFAFMMTSNISLPAAPEDRPEYLDLASDSAWTLSVDGGTPRPIRVPGGGYNSDLQPPPWIDQKSVIDHVDYEREFTVPKDWTGRALALEFGAVNFGAEVFVDCAGNPGTDASARVGSHDGPLIPFRIELPSSIIPGETCRLRVKARTLASYQGEVAAGFTYEETWKSPADGWSSRFGQGIVKSVRLVGWPTIAVSDVFVKPSVKAASLSANVTIKNRLSQERSVLVEASLSSWNATAWSYPEIAPVRVSIPAGEEVTVTLEPVSWGLGPGSYWWPNLPFREDYTAQLHHLNLVVRDGEQILHRTSQRFGFVEWGEAETYYTVNGVRMNFLGDGTPESGMSDYDAYSTSPAFLPPTGPGTGCAETWKRFMRMGINTNRTHQSTPTPHMLEAADEVGFTLIVESPIRGSASSQKWNEANLKQCLREMGEFSRNHPSVCRYSVQNEYPPNYKAGWEVETQHLIDGMMAGDPTRPITFEANFIKAPGLTLYGPQTGGPAHAMMHYVPHPAPATMITGIGECAWGTELQGDGLERFALLALDGRRQNIAYYAVWDWLNYWPNFLEGMNAERHAWKQPGNWHPDRMDGVDGWGSPIIAYLQRCFHPFLVLDYAFYQSNGVYGASWPSCLPSYPSGATIARELEIFNDSLAARNLEVRWSARWDGPTGPEVASGVLHVPDLPAGFHVTRRVAFLAPATRVARRLFFVLKSLGRDGDLFEDDAVCFNVVPGLVDPP